jgi:flagellar hook assembly protein FlgD
LGCHNDDPNDNIPDKTLIQASAGAANMHSLENIAQHNNEISLGVYPNPTKGLTNINFTLSNSGLVSVEIFNTSGQLVYSNKNQQFTAGNNLIQWDGNSNTGNSIESGYYFIQVTTGNHVSVQKLIMMK